LVTTVSQASAELHWVLLGGGVARQLPDRARLDVDPVQVVLLVAVGVLGEDDAPPGPVPGESGLEGPRHLAVAHLPRGAVRAVP
jgi:hypothetical protein